jgi:hypothetical protein
MSWACVVLSLPVLTQRPMLARTSMSRAAGAVEVLLP